MININLKEYNQALDRAIDECSEQIPKANNQNLFTLLNRISQLRKEQAEITQRINEQKSQNNIEPSPVQNFEKSIEINDASSDSADSFSTQIHSQESSASSIKTSEVNIQQRNTLSGQFNKAMEILEKEEMIVKAVPRVQEKEDLVKEEPNDKNVKEMQFIVIEDEQIDDCIVIDDDEDNGDDENEDQDEENEDQDEENEDNDEVNYNEQIPQQQCTEQNNLNNDSDNNRNPQFSTEQCARCKQYNQSQLELQQQASESIRITNIIEDPDSECEQISYPEIIANTDCEELPNPEIIDLETFIFDNKNTNCSLRNSSLSVIKQDQEQLCKNESIQTEQKYIHPLHYIQDESIEDLQDSDQLCSLNKSNIKFIVSEQSLLEQGFSFFQDSLLNYKTSLEWNHPQNLDFSQLFKRNKEIYNNHQIVTAKAHELMNILVANRAQGLKKLKSQFQQYFSPDQFAYLVQYGTVVLEYLSARGVEDDITLHETVKLNGKIINIDLLARSTSEVIIIDWQFSNEHRSNLILQDSLNGRYLDQIAGIESIERSKKVSLMILSLKNMPIQLVEYTLGEIESVQNQKCKEYKYYNEMLLRAKREQKIIPKQVKQRIMECWNGQELTIGEIFKSIQMAFNKKNEKSNNYYKHFSRISNAKLYTSQNEREGQQERDRNNSNSSQQNNPLEQKRMLVNFYHIFLFCKELQRKNGVPLHQL